jgi:hypothetical protein
MATTNDAMYAALKLLYPTAGTTLGDLLAAHWVAVGSEGQMYRGSLGYEYYVLQGASGTTLADLANNFWNDPDFTVSNLELETGNDLLLEDGSFMLLEVGNG